MRCCILYLITCLVSALVPFLGHTPAARPAPAAESAPFPGWPACFDGRPLRPLPVAAREAVMLERFPGQVGCFTDGERQLVLRWVSAATHDLHPASTCFRGRGFSITPQHARLDADGQLWGRFLAERDDAAWLVSERIFATDGRTWPDVSAWYWSVLLAGETGPWWSIVIVEQADTRGG